MANSLLGGSAALAGLRRVCHFPEQYQGPSPLAMNLPPLRGGGAGRCRPVDSPGIWLTCDRTCIDLRRGARLVRRPGSCLPGETRMEYVLLPPGLRGGFRKIDPRFGSLRRGRQPFFDIVSEINHAEMHNAVVQAQHEVAVRYDFKGTKAGIEFNKKENTVTLAGRPQGATRRRSSRCSRRRWPAAACRRTP